MTNLSTSMFELANPKILSAARLAVLEKKGDARPHRPTHHERVQQATQSQSPSDVLESIDRETKPKVSAIETHQGSDIRRAALTPSSFDTLPDSGYVRQAQIIPDVIPVSSASWWRGVKSGRYPKPVKFSERVTAWRVGDIRQLLAEQLQSQA